MQARALLAAIAFAVSSAASAVHADPAGDPVIEELRRRLADLERRHRDLERRVEAPPPPPPAVATPAVTFSAEPGKGFTIRTRDGTFSSSLFARVQLRNTVAFDPGTGTVTDEANVKTLRFWIRGSALLPDLKYAVQLAFGSNDFEKDNPSPIFDAWVEYTGLRDVQLRVGQFFVPFDRARTTREFALQFVDRQQVVRELTLDRDLGLMASSQDLFGAGGVLNYAVFVGGGDGRNRFGSQKPGPLLSVRLGARPFGLFDDDQEGDLTRRDGPRLAVGIAAAYNWSTSRQSSTYGPTLATGSVDYLHAAVDVVFKYAGFSFLAEAVRRQASVAKRSGEVDGAPKEEWTRSGYGYFLQAGMMVHRLVEVTARWEDLHADAGTDPDFLESVRKQGRQAGAGFNVYFNGHHLKLQSDWFYLFGMDPAAGKHAIRMQLDASF